MKTTKVHRRSRGLIIRDGHVLLAKAKGYTHTFLPGGLVEIGGAEEALVRELKNELGVEAKIKRFLGDVEYEWESSKHHNLELSHIFEIESNGFDEYFYFSQGTQLDFFWVKLEDLHRFNLQPASLYEMIEIRDSISSFWKSSLGSKKR